MHNAPEDSLRDSLAELKTLEFRAMLGDDNEREVSLAKEAAKRYQRDILANSEANPIETQRLLIIRYAERRGFDPDVCAEAWIANNSRNFREVWESGERDVERIEAGLEEKRPRRV